MKLLNQLVKLYDAEGEDSAEMDSENEILRQTWAGYLKIAAKAKRSEFDMLVPKSRKDMFQKWAKANHITISEPEIHNDNLDVFNCYGWK